MKVPRMNFPLTAVAGFMGWVICVTQAGADEIRELKTQADKMQYAIGVSLIGNLKNQGVEADLPLIVRGMKDALQGGGLLLSQDDFQTALTDYRAEVRKNQSETAARRVELNKAGSDFMKQNSTREGVVALPSGVQYRVIRNGSGKKPTLQDHVSIHYRITRVDGKQMGSTYTDLPRISPLSKAMPGLQEVLLLMQEGAKWEVVLPPSATGRKDPMDDVGVLVYELELVAVNPELPKSQTVNSEGKEAKGK